MEKLFLVFIFKINLGYILVSYLIFWLYILGLIDFIYFILKDKDIGEEIYQIKFNVEFEQGIISLKLFFVVLCLKVGKEYCW